jgi:dihydroxyacetone kinase-like protein
VNGDNRAVFATLRSIGPELRQHEQYLCELDSAVGDGDHGVTIVRCWDAVERRMAAVEGESLSDALGSLGAAVFATGGGAIGPLLGAALVNAGAVIRSDEQPAFVIAAALEAAAEGISSRGRANVGDCTLLDALHPAALAAQMAAREGRSVPQVIAAAAVAADEGAKGTAPMIARAGRAVRMGERAIGHMDPGAVSVAIMFRAAADHLNGGSMSGEAEA